MGNKTIGYFVSLVEGSDKLNKKEKDVLAKRAKGRTLEKIGKKYKVSGERIRQIEGVALIKFMKKIYQLLLFDKMD